MDRMASRLFIGLAGLLCLVGIAEFLGGILEILKKAYFVLVWLLKKIVPSFLMESPIGEVILVEEPSAVGWLYRFVQLAILLSATLVAIGSFKQRRNALLQEKYACMGFLTLALIYIIVVFGFAAFEYFSGASKYPAIALYLSEKADSLGTTFIQLILVAVATVYLDRELNRQEGQT